MDLDLIYDTATSKVGQQVGDLSTGPRRSVVKSPVASIPPELLTSVFILVKALDEAEHWNEKHLDWINVTHVCRFWREVGIRARCLWTNIPLFSIEWTEEMLKRSNGSSLTATVDFTESIAVGPHPQASQTILCHFSQIEELNLRGLTNSWLRKYLDQTASFGLPLRLHTLRISGYADVDFDDDNSEVVVISDEYFSPASLNSLRRLALSSNYIVDWKNASFLFKLTHLFVSDTPSGVLFANGVERCLEILRNMPALESVDLEYFKTLPEERPTINPLPSNFRMVHLPRLKTLRLSVIIGQLEVILPAVNLSSDVLLRLYCYEYDQDLSSVSRIFSACSMHLQHPDTPDGQQTFIQSLEWSPYSYNEKRIRVWMAPLSQEELNTMNQPPKMETLFSWDNEVELTDDIEFQRLLQSFNLEHLVSLSISDADFADCKTWATTFGTLPRLQIINLGTKPLRGFLQALVLGINYKGAQQSLPFPSLCSLSVTLKGLVKDSLRITQQLILHALNERSHVGFGLQQLIIRNTKGLTRNIMDQIRDIVPDVQKIWTPFHRLNDPALEAYLEFTNLEEMDVLMGVWR